MKRVITRMRRSCGRYVPVHAPLQIGLRAIRYYNKRSSVGKVGTFRFPVRPKRIIYHSTSRSDW